MKVQIVEVGPRDGLQNEKEVLSTEDKIRLIELLAEAGLTKIEATSFVNPKWIPQLADAREVLSGLTQVAEKVSLSALVPNLKGFERAEGLGLREVAVFMSASETHNLKNINKSIDDTFPVLKEVAVQAKEKGLRVRGYVSTVFGCPYEDKVSHDSVLRVTDQLFQMGVDEVSLGDTIGVATPTQVKEVLSKIASHFDVSRIAGHFHDTRGTGLANVVAALEEGVRIFDSSIGGLGGCPYAPGASGNISTEDLVYLLEGMGYETGVQQDKLAQAGLFIQKRLGRILPSKVLQACAGKREE